MNSVPEQSHDLDDEQHQKLLNPVPGQYHEGKQRDELDEELLNPVLGENLEDAQHELHGNSPLSSAMQPLPQKTPLNSVLDGRPPQARLTPP